MIVFPLVNVNFRKPVELLADWRGSRYNCNLLLAIAEADYSCEPCVDNDEPVC